MVYLGCHLSSGKGFRAMVRTAESIGADTFAYFTRNPRGSKGKDPDKNDIAAALAEMKEQGFGKLVAHGAYTMNLCTADPEARAFAASVLADDLRRMADLPGQFYNFHPGSHVGQGIDAGMALIVELLDAILRPEQTTRVLLETMSGKGTEVGSRFEELGHILRSVSLGDKMGVCLDTCHVYSAGYDIVNDLDGVLEQFDRHVGLGKLYAIHLNDSLMPFASRKDRHARIGEGTIGLEAIARIINHPALRHLPFYLETPNELPGYAHEISVLRAAWIE